MDTPARPAFPAWVLIVVTIVVLILVTMLGVGVVMANVMSCDSGAEGCAERAMAATLVWAAVSYLGPLGAMTWGLIAKGTRSRVIALLLVLLLPVVGLALNLAILFV